MQSTARKPSKRSGKTEQKRAVGDKPDPALIEGAVEAKPVGRRAPRERTHATAETLAAKQRDIAVSEFFAKNRHLLGFDNPRKALLTTVKEAVDNSLDACEEAGILPDLKVELEHLPQVGEGRFRVTIEDNGPGIVRKQIDNIFGKLLYGSKFHRLKMSRGQQGIGISAAGMYGLMTTGRPMVIVTRPKKGRPAHHVELAMDTTKNRPEVSVDVETEDFPEHTGTRVTIELEARYMRGRTSVDEYLEQTAIANPHAEIMFKPPAKASAEESEEPNEKPRGRAAKAATELLPEPPAPDGAGLTHTTRVGEWMVFPRAVKELPPEPVEIKPHPKGVELGTLMQMLKQTEERTLTGFLQESFSRVSTSVAHQICDGAGLKNTTQVKSIGHDEIERIYKSIQAANIMAPPLDCLAPIGTRQILAGLLKGVKAEFYTASTRPPAVYRGNPFQIEVGLAFGGELAADELARVIRFANRVPLLYQPSACALQRAVVETAWRNYGVSQSRGALPEGPLVIMIHMASVWVPFTSESKEAIADYDEITKEMKLALQECGRKLASYLRRRQRIRREGERRDIFRRYIPEVVRALHVIDSSLDRARIAADLEAVARQRTEMADEEVDESGRPVKREQTLGGGGGDEDTVIIESAAQAALDRESPPPPDPQPEARPARKKSKKAAAAGSKPRRSAGADADDESLF